MKRCVATAMFLFFCVWSTASHDVNAKPVPECAISKSVIQGKASWYGPGFHGRKTANGEVYDMYGMTAAHKSLKLGTTVRVENLRNGQVAVLRINDRGPYIEKRILDVSKRAAEVLGFRDDGLAPVRISVCG